MTKSKKARGDSRREERQQRQAIETIIWEREVVRANEEWIEYSRRKEEELQKVQAALLVQQIDLKAAERRIQEMEQMIIELRETISIKQQAEVEQKEKVEELERKNNQAAEDNNKTSSLFDRLWDTVQEQISIWKKMLESKTSQIDGLNNRMQQMKKEQRQMMQEADNVIANLRTKVAMLEEVKEKNEQATNKLRQDIQGIKQTRPERSTRISPPEGMERAPTGAEEDALESWFCRTCRT